MGKKVLMLATVPSMIGHFNMENIAILQNLDCEVHVAADFTDTSVWPLESTEAFLQEMQKKNIPCIQIDFSRSYLKINRHVKAYKQLVKLLQKENYSFIHTHTPIASALARIAAHKTKTKIIYTAHGFHFFKGAPFKNWIFFYPIEFLLSRWTDILLTINQEDYQRAKKHFAPKKLIYLPGIGIDTSIFEKKIDISAKRKELGLMPQDIIIFSNGELSHRKNQKIVIEALSQLKEKARIHYFICGTGAMESELKKLAVEHNIHLHLLGFRHDVPELFQVCDLFIFPSLQEGLPVALMEAIASDCPILCSRIRGSVDLVSDWNFAPQASHELSEKLSTLFSGLENKDAHTYFRKIMADSIANNKTNLASFSSENVNKITESIYKRFI